MKKRKLSNINLVEDASKRLINPRLIELQESDLFPAENKDNAIFIIFKKLFDGDVFDAKSILALCQYIITKHDVIRIPEVIDGLIQHITTNGFDFNYNGNTTHIDGSGIYQQHGNKYTSFWHQGIDIHIDSNPDAYYHADGAYVRGTIKTTNGVEANNGFWIPGKTTQDLLTAQGTTISVADLKLQLGLSDLSLYKIVSELPQIGEENKIYLVRSSDNSSDNNFKEYIYVNDKYEQLGESDVVTYYYNEDTYSNEIRVGRIIGGSVSSGYMSTVSSGGIEHFSQIYGGSAIKIKIANGGIIRTVGDEVDADTKCYTTDGGTYNISGLEHAIESANTYANDAINRTGQLETKLQNVNGFVFCTQEEYNALQTKEPGVIYYIEEQSSQDESNQSMEFGGNAEEGDNGD